ncbi:MAG: T9SS type A sorting domain-containing protein, partial [Methanococcaceae archaeon]
TQYVDSTLAAGLFLANGIVPGVLLLCGIIEGTQDILFAYDIGTVNNVPVVTSLNRSFSFEDPKASSSYRIVGLPGDINLTAAQFMGQAGEHKKDWNIYYDNGQNQNYLVEYNNSDNFTFKPGRAFWMLSRNPVNLSMQTNMVSTDFNSYTINLQSGWNLISSPFLNGVSWSAVKTANNLANNALIYSWNGAWSNPQTMSPYEGYYFNNINNLRALRIPDAKMLPKTNPAESYGLERSIKISLRQDGKEYSAAFAAVNEKSSPGYDDFDYFCPPSDFSTLNIFIRNENLAVSYKNLFIDSRPPESEGEVFDLEIKNQSGKEAVLGFEGLESFTASQVFLEDVLMGKFYDLKNDKEIKIDAEHGEKRYNLVIGKAEFIENLQKQRIPLEYGLLPNYPNPFNPASKISYMLPKAGYAVIKVFDITGREVVTLAEGMHEAGRYEVTFDGSHLASGVYFYQLRSGAFTQTRNMFLLK